MVSRPDNRHTADPENQSADDYQHTCPQQAPRNIYPPSPIAQGRGSGHHQHTTETRAPKRSGHPLRSPSPPLRVRLLGENLLWLVAWVGHRGFNLFIPSFRQGCPLYGPQRMLSPDEGDPYRCDGSGKHKQVWGQHPD